MLSPRRRPPETRLEAEIKDEFVVLEDPRDVALTVGSFVLVGQ
jgi:hypothetical protein